MRVRPLQGRTVCLTLHSIELPDIATSDFVLLFRYRMSFWAETLQKNRHSEMQKNDERFQFLKYVDASFDNITVVPPGTGVMHQVNLEYLARKGRVETDLFSVIVKWGSFM